MKQNNIQFYYYFLQAIVLIQLNSPISVSFYFSTALTRKTIAIIRRYEQTVITKPAKQKCKAHMQGKNAKQTNGKHLRLKLKPN